MDIRLSAADIMTSDSGQYCYISGPEEIIQRALICAKVKKGNFIYNKDLGTELRSIDVKDTVAVKTAEVLINEAMMGSVGAEIKVNSMEKTEDGNIKLIIAAVNGEETKTAEVTVIADV